jgi:hypothetical protein
MNHGLLAELFRCAGSYHGALADYAGAMRKGSDLESAMQRIVGTSLRYRLAIDRLLLENDAESLAMVASRGRIQRLRKILLTASRRYNLAQHPPAG